MATAAKLKAPWPLYRWRALGGYSSGGDGETRGKINKGREVIAFSPHCLKAQQGAMDFDNNGERA